MVQALQDNRTVYALDLPGYGASYRTPVSYNVVRYVDAIVAAARHIQVESGVQFIDTVALSLTAEFLARAAQLEPETFRRLVLVTPTGFQAGAARLRDETGQPKTGVTAPERILRLPGVGDLVFTAFSNAPSIRFFLKVTFGGGVVPQPLVDCALQTVKVEGAKHAVLAFASGKLFSSDIRTLYERLSHPVWLAHGTKGPFCRFGDVAWVDDHPNWCRTQFDTGAFPHFEQPADFNRRLVHFLTADDVATAL